VASIILVKFIHIVCIDVLHVKIQTLQNTEIHAERYTFDRKERGRWTHSDHSTEMIVWKQIEEQ
jgi:hypothetical protein